MGLLTACAVTLIGVARGIDPGPVGKGPDGYRAALEFLAGQEE